ncbi:MAG: hypothetical protein R3E13_10625 [Alphaproteobacteria bacterium]
MLKIDTMPILYFSQLDEDHFFAWAREIDCIKSVKGGYLHIATDALNEENLRDLLALFGRYKLSGKALSSLCNEGNKHWFKNKDAYWYDNVFDEN